jgi:putative transposase
MADLMARFCASQRKVCSLIGLSRSSWHYQSIARDSSALQVRSKEITDTRKHYGYRRVHVMLKREGWKDNHKRVFGLYQEKGVVLKIKVSRQA